MYDTLVDEQAAWFERSMGKVLTTMQKGIASFVGDLETTNGILINSDLNLAQAYQSYTALSEQLQRSGYYQLVEAAQAKENDILKYMRANRPTGAVPFAFTAATAERLQGLSGVYANEFAAVATDQLRAIHGIISKSVMAGLESDLVIQEIWDVLDSKLKRYATTYFNTSRGDFIQAVEYANASQYDGELFWEYQGPADDLTRPVCREGLGMDSSSYPNAPLFTDEERIAFDGESMADRQYNCRHDMIQITEEYYFENVGK